MLALQRRVPIGCGKPVVYRQGVVSKMIKVDEQTHARLAELAAERSATIGGYVGELVGAQRTHAEWEAIGQQSEDYLREHFGYDLAPEERAQLIAEHAAIMADLHDQFAVRRGEQRTSA